MLIGLFSAIHAISSILDFGLDHYVSEPFIRESVDSLCRDGTDTPLYQQLDAACYCSDSMGFKWCMQ